MTLKTGVKMLKLQLCITGINNISEYIKRENVSFKFKNYFTILLFLLYFYLINPALVSIIEFFQKY